MYKLLLCLRYLRTRYIALASIISVTLGVATMIVVNSVMSGFSHEMHKRLHGILSDVVVRSHSLDGFPDVEGHMKLIREEVGEENIVGMTPVVHVPAMLNFQFRGQWITRQVNLIGIDTNTYAGVSDFSKYLLHPDNERQLSFELHDGGYEDRFPVEPGWPHRRARVAYERACDEAYRRQREQLQQTELPQAEPPADWQTPSAAEQPFPVRPAAATEPVETGGAPDPFAARRTEPGAAADPFAARTVDADGAMGSVAARPLSQLNVFDEMTEQHTGVILGIAMASVRKRDPEGVVQERFLCLPGDDVKITFPTAGQPPQAVSDTFTVVDFYECKMSEYDASFAFMPLHKLQELRGMIDPMSGEGYVSSIQIKLKEGTDLTAVRDKLRTAFAAGPYPYQVETWRDMQGPLLSAVEMEKMILNILLFLIIAVAGFGILATFYMIVVEKTKDVGILKSLGAPSRGIMSIFLGYGLSLGIVGSGVGMALGVLFVININRIAAAMAWCTGRELFPQDIYYFQKIPTILDPWTIAWIVAGAMSIAVLASVLPAIRAARLHPVEALRYE